MGPVFLFDVGIVVFVIGSGTGELDGLISLGEVPQEVLIEKFGAVVGIEAQQREREGIFDIFELLEDTGFTFSPEGSLFGPTGGNIDDIEGIDEHSGQRITAMGDGIGFDESGTGFIPLIGLDRDLFFEQGTWFGGAASSFLILEAHGFQEPVDGCGGDSKKCAIDI